MGPLFAYNQIVSRGREINGFCSKMKKRMISLTLVVLIVAAMFAGCGSDGPEGTWKVKSIDGQDASAYVQLIAGLVAGFGGDKVNADELTKKVEQSLCYTLKSGGVVTIVKWDDNFESSQNVNGTWKLDGDKINLSFEDVTMEGVMKDNQITFAQEKGGKTSTIVMEKE